MMLGKRSCINALGWVSQNLSPLILLASWRSLVMMVTLLAWMAHKLVSSKRDTRYAYAAYCSANTAWLWNLTSCLNSWAISLTSLWKGSFRMRRSVDFWYFLISLKATVPGLNLCGFFTPEWPWPGPPTVSGADFLAIFWATSCFLGTFIAVDLRAVCFVLAIIGWVSFSLVE